MNERLAPFNKLEVRQAINYAIDRAAIAPLRRARDGNGERASADVPAVQEDLHVPARHGEGEAARAAVGNQARLSPSGRARETHQKAAEYLTDILNQLGYKAKLRAIDPAIYWATIGNQKTKAQTGLANWFQDYPHPLNWFDTLLNGNRITEEHNNNYSNADVAAINTKIEELKKDPELTDEINSQWAEVDQMVLENASWAPFVNRQFTDFFKADMDLDSCYVNHVLYQFDYIQACKKG